MRNKSLTKQFYIGQLGFKELSDFGDYLILGKDNVELHFFEFKKLNTRKNYGQVYIRTDAIDSLYRGLVENRTSIHPNGHLQDKPWGQREFALLDPDNNLLTFGQGIQH